MEVLVFKTDVSQTSDVKNLQNMLARFANIKKVTVDLDDCDRVLRIVGINPSPTQIELLMSSLGFSCREME